MPRSVQRQYTANLLASAARTITGTSSAINFPTDLDGGIFILDVTAVTATTPTLNVRIDISMGDATPTWYQAFRFAQVTAVSVRRLSVTFRRFAEAGAEAAITNTGTTAIATNCPVTDSIRFGWTIGGTSPSFTFAVWFVGVRAALAE